MAFRHSSNEPGAAEPYYSASQDLQSPFGRRLHPYGAYHCMTSVVDRLGYEDATLEHQIPSLQRFLLEPDQSPLTSDFLGTKDIALFGETSRGSVYGMYSPWSTATNTNRPNSPEDSSCSSSCGATWTANSSVCTLSPELLQHSFPGFMSRLPSQQGFYCPQGSLFPSFPQESSPGGSFIALRDVEKVSEAEPGQDPTCLGFPAVSSPGQMYPAYPELVQLGHDHSYSSPDDENLSDAVGDLDAIQPSPYQNENDSEYQPNSTSTPTQRRLHSSSQNSSTEATSSRSSNKGSGPTPVGPLSMVSSTRKRVRSNRRRSIKQQANPQAFPCPLAAYGCPTTFSSKNEWKRHVTSKHVLLERWRCELCPPSERGPNVFNRKDLFTQHLRRMHGPQPQSVSDGPPLPKRRRSNLVAESDDEFEKSLEGIRNRCWIEVRSAPTASACLFCPETFSGHGSWQKRLDHVGLHMENAIKGNGTACMDQNGRRNCDNLAEGDSDTIYVKHEHSDSISVKHEPSNTISVKHEPSDTISVKHEPSDTISVQHERAVGVPPSSQWNVDHALEEWMLAQGLLKRSEDGNFVLVEHDANELKLDSLSFRKRRLTEDDDAEGEYE